MTNFGSIARKIRKGIQLAIAFSIVFIGIFSPNSPITSLSNIGSEIPNLPKVSDVAGSEMYSEQLSAYIAGDTSIIKQGYITNDSNILKGFDYNDPAFHECSVLIASSNGITPKMFPSPFSKSAFGAEKFLTYDCFYGFLYYDPPSGKTISDRPGRALTIIENLFNIQLFMVESFDDQYFYPFFGFYPNWGDLFDLVINNAPQDGYWGAIDTDRLLSDQYITNHHISSYILMLESIETLTDGFDFPPGFEKYSIEPISTSFADVSEISTLFGGIFSLLNFSSGAFSLFDTTELLSSDSKFVTTILQYEGAEEGIQHISDNKYEFDLMKALNYNVSVNGPLAPSKKVYISLVGAMLSEIDVSIYSSDILSFKPLYNHISSYILDSIVEAAFLLGQTIDISIITDFALRTFWRTDDAVNRIVTNLYDYTNIANPLNLLTTLSLTGLPVIPTGILEPLNEFSIEYAVNETEPTLRIEKDYRLLSFDTGEYELDITVTNTGDTPAWGRKIEFPILNQTFLPLPEVITEFIETEYNMSATEYLIPDEPPRFIFIDSLGSGVYDYLYPTITDITQLTFYKPDFAEDILDPVHDDYFISYNITQEEREIFADLFNQTNSIFHEKNWKLDPGESITYTLSDLSIEPFYEYTSFHDLNFTISGDDSSPYVSYGQTVTPSKPSDALTLDNITWDITSEQIGEDNLIQAYFSFENTSIIDLYNSSLDQIGLNCQFSSDLDLSMNTDFTLEFYNRTSMGFDLVNNTLYSTSNSSIDFSTSVNLLDYVDPSNNHQTIFKLTFNTNSQQVLSIDQIILQFYDRDLGPIIQSPAIVAYTTYTGHNTYFIDSNPIAAVSDPGPILIATANLGHYNSSPGMLNTYNLSIENVGSLQAEAVNITLKTPGIVADSGNFTLIDGYLLYNLTSIDAGVFVQNLSFSFYTPNSNNLPLAEITYNHPITILNETHPDFTTTANDLFLSAPIDYKTSSPFLFELRFHYSSNYTDAHMPWGIAPQVGDVIRLDLFVENLSNITLSDLNCSIPNNVLGLERLDNFTSEFINLLPNSNQSFSTEVNKTYWNALMFPGIDNFNSSQIFSIQISRKCPLILGYKDFQVEKSFSDYDATHNSIITVNINVTNTGNLHVYDLTVIDFSGYPKDGFSLVNGTPDKYIPDLVPNETFLYSYTLKLNKQGTYEIVPASISYNYITQQTAYSDPFVVKVRNNWLINALYVIGPSIAGGIATGLIYWYKKRYDLEAAEFSRREELMFGQDLRSVAWNKRTLQEDLFELKQMDEINSQGGKET